MASGTSRLQVVWLVVVTSGAVINLGCFCKASGVPELADPAVSDEYRSADARPVSRQPRSAVAVLPCHYSPGRERRSAPDL